MFHIKTTITESELEEKHESLPGNNELNDQDRLKLGKRPQDLVMQMGKCTFIGHIT